MPVGELSTVPPTHPCGVSYYSCTKGRSHLNLNTIDTVQELLNQNQVEPTVDDIVDSVLEEDEKSKVDTILDEDLTLEETYKLTLSLIQRLGSFHQTMIEQIKEEGDTDRLIVWCQDEQILHTSYDMIQEVSDHE